MTVILRTTSVSRSRSAPSSTKVSYAQLHERATTRPGDSDPGALDQLMSRLSAKNPRFARKLRTTGQKMAHLALGESGEDTLLSLRMTAGLTQAQFADAIGQKQANVSLMESGARVNLQRKTMHAMCEALHCSIAKLDAALTASEGQYNAHASCLSPAEQAIDDQKRRCA